MKPGRECAAVEAYPDERNLASALLNTLICLFLSPKINFQDCPVPLGLWTILLGLEYTLGTSESNRSQQKSTYLGSILILRE